MDAKEIFDLIVKADERLKYATSERGDSRAAQARELLDRALAAARRIGNDSLVEQAQRRLADLDALAGADAGDDREEHA